MPFRLAADAVLLIHFCFILFALFGALLAVRWRWIPLLHLPAACWGFYMEISGRICPLTYLENHFRQQAGQTGYSESFVEHYLLPVVYPTGLTQAMQYGFAAVVVATNLAIYCCLYRRHRPKAAVTG